jgi:hypothetical protein
MQTYECCCSAPIVQGDSVDQAASAQRIRIPVSRFVPPVGGCTLAPWRSIQLHSTVDLRDAQCLALNESRGRVLADPKNTGPLTIRPKTRVPSHLM